MDARACHAIIYSLIVAFVIYSGYTFTNMGIHRLFINPNPILASCQLTSAQWFAGDQYNVSSCNVMTLYRLNSSLSNNETHFLGPVGFLFKSVSFLQSVDRCTLFGNTLPRNYTVPCWGNPSLSYMYEDYRSIKSDLVVWGTLFFIFGILISFCILTIIILIIRDFFRS